MLTNPMLAVIFKPVFTFLLGFPAGSDGKESACNVRDLDSIPGLGRSPGGGKGLPAPVKWINAISRVLAAAGCITSLNSWNNSIQPLYCHLQLVDEETGRGKLKNLTKVTRLYTGKWKSLSCVWLFATPWAGCSRPGSSVHGILQARILERVAIPFSRGSSQPRDQTWVSCIAGRFFTIWAYKWEEIQFFPVRFRYYM